MTTSSSSFAGSASRDVATFRVAITGGRTFLGDRLIRALEQEPACEHILVCDIKPPLSGGDKTRFVRLDLTDPSADEHLGDRLVDDGIDVLVHTALLAYPSHSRSWAHELEAIGSLYVMNAAAEGAARGRTRKLVLTSTTAVYGAYASNPAFLSEDHPLQGIRGSRWVMDKVSVEKELARLTKDAPNLVTTSLRYCMTVGPTIRNFYTKLLARQVVPTVMGYDPLVQFLHEDDAVRALVEAVLHDHPGAYNIVGDGTLYYSDVLRLGGKITVPVPHILGYPVASALFEVQLSVVPGTFLNFFRYSWVADGRKMRDKMRFLPRYSSREAVLAFYDSLGPARADDPGPGADADRATLEASARGLE
ncbi:MAG: NAD-dependent epimerase/dehydratase family protein [Deltaproteobacteria bacterium]|nr:NAD-dependent epimerase/dehydratase family protein [Deltaproteobacteria bacterium]